MTLPSKFTSLLAVCACILDLATGIYLLLVVLRDPRDETLGIVTCIVYCIVGILDIASLFTIRMRQSMYIKATGIISVVVQLLIAGATLTKAFLGSHRDALGSYFCPGQNLCMWAGSRALLTGFVLWCCSVIFQVLYVILYLTGRASSVKPSGGGQEEQETQSPVPSLRSNVVMTEAQAFRYPLTRSQTDEEPFTLEAALKSKTQIASQAPPGHQTSQSGTSQSSTHTFVPSHMTDGHSQQRSWASTLQTPDSIASPRSSKFAINNSPLTETLPSARSLSPHKIDSNWGIASNKKSHNANKDSQSSFATHSSASSKQSRPTRKTPNMLFHLPSSPAGRPDTSPFAVSLLRRTHTKSRSQLDTSLPDEEGGLDTLSEEPHAEKAPSSRRSSFSPSKLPKERKRSGVFSLRPLLPGSPKSWTQRSPKGSPTRRSFLDSPTKRTVPIFDSEAAFGEWDTSNLDSEPYLFGMNDTRNISGSSNIGLPEDASRRGSAQSEASLWQGRSVRIASDGSVVARTTPADSKGRRVSTVGLDVLRQGVEIGAM